MKKLLQIILLFFSATMLAQVGINTTTPAAQLEITSSNQVAPANTDGIIIPRIDAFPATNPTALQQGMMVYLTTISGVNQPGFYYWDDISVTWKNISGVQGWGLTGNNGTVAGTNYIGTSDNVDVSIKANALERIRIQSGTGNIGLNTPTPASQLQITSSNQANPSNTDGIIIPKVDIFPITNPTALQQGMMVYLTTVSGINQPGFYYWDNVTVTWKSISGDKGWGLTGNNGTVAGTNYIGTQDNIDLVFDTNAIERMRIKQSTGNIGVGTAFPSESFQVVNNMKIGNSIWFNAANDRLLKFGDNNFVTIGEEFADDVMSFKAKTFVLNPNTAFNTGFVGIGVINPLANLHVLNPSFDDTDTNVFIARNSGTQGSTWTMGSVEFYTEGQANIGFSTSVCPVNSNGGANLGSPNSNKYLGFRWGTLFCTANPNVSSDITLKKEIKPLQYGLEAVRKINPISYIFKTEKLPNGKELEDSEKTKMLGFSAQELLQVIPEVVSTSSWITKDEKTYYKNNTETLGVRYGDIIPVAINAVKELDKQVQEKTFELQEKIKILEAQNSALEKRLRLIEEKLLK
jgi:Chaperone of endosialidase